MPFEYATMNKNVTETGENDKDKPLQQVCGGLSVDEVIAYYLGDPGKPANPDIDERGPRMLAAEVNRLRDLVLFREGELVTQNNEVLRLRSIARDHEFSILQLHGNNVVLKRRLKRVEALPELLNNAAELTELAGAHPAYADGIRKTADELAQALKEPPPTAEGETP